jgi:hypothetical protein
MSIHRWSRLGAGLLLLLLAVGLGPASAASEESRPYEAGRYEWRFENKSFRATSVKGADGGSPLRNPEDLHLAFGWTAIENGPWRPALFWEANCNEYNYDFKANANRFLLSEGGSTLVGCVGPIAREDRWLDRFFSSRPLWRLQDGKLRLVAGKRVLRLRRVKHYR